MERVGWRPLLLAPVELAAGHQIDRREALERPALELRTLLGFTRKGKARPTKAHEIGGGSSGRPVGIKERLDRDLDAVVARHFTTQGAEGHGLPIVARAVVDGDDLFRGPDERGADESGEPADELLVSGEDLHE